MKSRDLYISPSLRPLVRAYLLGYISYISPRLLQILSARLQKKKPDKSETGSAFRKIWETLKKGLGFNRFPAFCGVTVGGWRILLPVIEGLLNQINSSKSNPDRARAQKQVANFLASLISGAVGFKLLNTGFEGRPAGRTLDLTLWTAARAIDIIIGDLWMRWKKRRLQSGRWSRAEGRIGKLADTIAFSVTAGTVMFAWFYLPEQLPRAYNKWITGMSNLDSRVIVALRRMRAGEFIYGQDTGQADLLGGYCKDLGLPEELGDPAKMIPIPCRLVHSGWTDNCELHAIWRFWTSWAKAFAMYFPLNLVVRLRNPSIKGLRQAFLQSCRSSAFLGTFVAFFYYAVCLTRSRIAPFFFPKMNPMMWDKGLIVKMGCLLCGWSVLIEAPMRRAEMSFFVAPRALGVLVPREYPRKYQWRETLAFALSFAVVITASQSNKARVRGVTGKVLASIVA